MERKHSTVAPRNLAAQRRNALERKHRGPLNSHVGYQSIIIDFGTNLTKVMVASDQTPRIVMVTPPAVSQAMRSAVAIEDVEEIVVKFVYKVCSQANVSHTGHTVIVLFNAVHNRVFEKLVVDTVSANTVHQRVRPMCTQVAALMAHNTNSGCVVDVGFSTSQCLPVLQDIGCQYDVSVSARGVDYVVKKLRDQILEDNPVFLQNQFHPINNLPDTMLINLLMQYGTIAPPVGDEARDATLHCEYPLVVKTIMVYAKPNWALEHFFTRNPAKTSSADVKAVDDAEEEAAGHEKTLQHILLAALKQCDPMTTLKDTCTSTVLVGGITQLPNFRARFALECHNALSNCKEEKKCVLMKKIAEEMQMPSLPASVSPTVAAVVGAAAIASSK